MLSQGNLWSPQLLTLQSLPPTVPGVPWAPGCTPSACMALPGVWHPTPRHSVYVTTKLLSVSFGGGRCPVVGVTGEMLASARRDRTEDTGIQITEPPFIPGPAADSCPTVVLLSFHCQAAPSLLAVAPGVATSTSLRGAGRWALRAECSVPGERRQWVPLEAKSQGTELH